MNLDPTKRACLANMPLMTFSCHLCRNLHDHCQYCNVCIIPQDTDDDDLDYSERGRILLSFCYDKLNKVLMVSIVRCSGLVPTARARVIDPQVKL